LLLAGLWCLGASPVVRAADTAVSSPRAADPLATARSQVAAGRWAEAVAELKRVNDSGSADWHNLMGYSLRKGSPPDLDGADRHYREALRIAPGPSSGWMRWTRPAVSAARSSAT
jgi:Flp pilus assembly protein TadD